MSLAQAQAAASQLRAALLDHGVRAVSVELQPGVSTSGWGVAPFRRGLGHHIVSRPPGTPGLALVKKGRPDLGGPLCNGYGGFDLVARIITMGWANHPGAGGPWSVPGWGTVPVNNGRPYVFGWEFEGGIVAYTDAMHDFMARCGAGTLDWLGTLPGNPGPAPVECWTEHSGWAPGRKIDRLGYTAASGRSRIAAVRGTNHEEDPLAGFSRNDLLGIIREGVATMALDANGKLGGGPGFIHFGTRFMDVSKMVSGIPAAVVNRTVGSNGETLWQLLQGEQAERPVTAAELAAALRPTLQIASAAAAREALAAGPGASADEIAERVLDGMDARARDNDPATGPLS